jgi:hypothetical protein
VAPLRVDNVDVGVVPFRWTGIPASRQWSDWRATSRGSGEWRDRGYCTSSRLNDLTHQDQQHRPRMILDVDVGEPAIVGSIRRVAILE